MKFEAWISDIEAIVNFDIDAESWRKYFEIGLKPLEAIDQHRVDEEVWQVCRRDIRYVDPVP